MIGIVCWTYVETLYPDNKRKGLKPTYSGSVILQDIGLNLVPRLSEAEAPAKEKDETKE